MGSIKRRIVFFAARFLAKRSWGRRVLWAFAVQLVRARVRQLVHALAEVFPVLAPVRAWV